MRFAELFLRLGASLVGWMIIIAYVLWLAVLPRTHCAASGDELYRLLLFFGPPAALLSTMILATAPLRDIQSILRWLAVLPALLLPMALIAIFRAADSIYIAAVPLCLGAELSAWQLAFTPVVSLSVGVIVWSCLMVWRSCRPKSSVAD